jgi:hypothetical protein
MWDAVRVQKCDVATGGVRFVEPGESIPGLYGAVYNSASHAPSKT